MKWLHREICQQRDISAKLASRTRRTSWTKGISSHAIPRRLPAEVAYDALKQATGRMTTRLLRSQTDLKGRAIAIAGTNGRNGKGTATLSFALQVFGRSTRESNCDCDRSMEASLLQTVYMQNDEQCCQLLGGRERLGGSTRCSPASRPNAKAKRTPPSRSRTGETSRRRWHVNEARIEKSS